MTGLRCGIQMYICTHTYIYNEILLGHQKHEILPFATTWMDLENIVLSEVNQKKKDKYRILYVESKT